MYIENSVKWHPTSLLKFISLTQAVQVPTKNKGMQYPLFIKFISTTSGFANKSTTNQSASQKPIKLESNTPIRLEISRAKINELLQHKQLCAADVRCLDLNSKQHLTKLCLQNCLANQ